MRRRTLSALVKLVIFGVVTAVLTFVLALTIANGSVGGSYTTYRAIFTDATSLLPGDDVRIAGVRVGQVQSITVYHRKYAEVTFGVQSNVPLYSSTTAQIRYLNLIGQRYVELIETPDGRGQLAQGATIPLSHTAPALDLTALFNGFQPLFHALDPQAVNKFAYDIIQTLQGEGGTFDQLLASTASFTNTVADQDAAVGALIDNLDSVLATVNARDAGLGSLIDNLQSLVTGLASNRNVIAHSLGNISSLAGRTASLLNGIRPVLPADLANVASLGHILATTKYPDGQVALSQFLKWLPWKLNVIIRTATYGSWFNFWLCNADARIGNMLTPRLHVTNSAACDTP
jgi:phospholipid/cholesterol/gamma-HCH transport system substrate-binding protein